MTNTEYNKLFQRDLGRLMDELNGYSDEEKLWVKVEGINNSAGNLFLHLCGNLQHFIGAQLGKTGYVRKRDFEFEGKVSLDQLREQIELTQKVIGDYFEGSDQNDYTEKYPLEPFGYSMTTHYFLNHLLGHLNYHRGQINYHRRILS